MHLPVLKRARRRSRPFPAAACARPRALACCPWTAPASAACRPPARSATPGARACPTRRGGESLDRLRSSDEVDIAAAVGAQRLEQARRVAVGLDRYRCAVRRDIRAEHERVQIRPRPAVGTERRLERLATDKHGLTARLELRPPVALARRRTPARRSAPPAAGRRHVAVRADTESPSWAPFCTAHSGANRRPRLTLPTKSRLRSRRDPCATLQDVASVPSLRASDADREQVAELLQHATAEGRRTADELDVSGSERCTSRGPTGSSKRWSRTFRSTAHDAGRRSVVRAWRAPPAPSLSCSPCSGCSRRRCGIRPRLRRASALHTRGRSGSRPRGPLRTTYSRRQRPR